MEKSETPFNFRLNNHRSEVGIPWKCNPHMPLLICRYTSKDLRNTQNLH